MSELYKLGFMNGLTGGLIEDDDFFFCFSSQFLNGVSHGHLIRSDFYKPDLYN